MEEYNTDPNEAVARVNAERNEMVALLQSAKGAKFVTVVAQPSSMNVTLSHESRMKGGVKYTYKAVDLDLKAGDFVLVQFRGRLGIGMVIEVLGEPPTSNEYDWTIEMKHVIQKLDIDRSRQLAQLDKNMLKTITNSEAQDRLERLTRQLGIAMDKITLELPPIEDSQVIEY